MANFHILLVAVCSWDFDDPQNFRNIYRYMYSYISHRTIAQLIVTSTYLFPVY